MSLIITFMFEPAKLQMNCASASGARNLRREMAEPTDAGSSVTLRTPETAADHGSCHLRASVPSRWPSWPGAFYASAFALIASNSVWVIVPESSSCLAWAISAAEPPAASRTY